MCSPVPRRRNPDPYAILIAPRYDESNLRSATGPTLPIKFIAAALWGSLMALLTLLMEGPLSLVSDNQFYAVVERCLFWLVMPGLVIGTTAGSLGLAVCANAAFHFSLCWLLLRIFFREHKREPEHRESTG